MRIAVDAMGTDNRPTPDIAGAVAVAKETGDTIILVGNKSIIENTINQHNLAGLNIEVVNAEEEIAMDDKPGIVAKGKPKSSMHIGMRMVKEGTADAFVTMGNTGAALAIATVPFCAGYRESNALP
jgi:glycerol-3-phosphate acyltransferase PlsX